MAKYNNLEELFKDQIVISKDNYGYDQKYFNPLAINVSDTYIQMLFIGFEVVLYPNGTYFIFDTTGG
jgi:hypothetical protein